MPYAPPLSTPYLITAMSPGGMNFPEFRKRMPMRPPRAVLVPRVR